MGLSISVFMILWHQWQLLKSSRMGLVSIATRMEKYPGSREPPTGREWITGMCFWRLHLTPDHFLSLLHHGCHKVSRLLCHTLPPPTHTLLHPWFSTLSQATVSHGLKPLTLRAIMNPSFTELFSKKLCQRDGKSD